ncbi:hypothetical protein [Deinococcus arcticus]|uniref:Uncharacterized protein n=1 Tax=Deinococcus arcticus TaxID=2136176 RepID=A0A2T3W3E3_9DEIO|nr:hypothetical protein [Deinococcus arcticus]PTA66418.1 hypothetical protein C8263_18045 [Deinococcus arcticus]
MTTPDLRRTLHASLDRRVRPEDLLTPITQLMADQLSPADRQRLLKAQRQARGAASSHWSSMPADFRRPAAPNLQVAGALFAAPLPPTDEPGVVAQLGQYLGQASAEIHKQVGESDFQRDRLNRDARAAAGLDLSRRQYNKRFRLVQRLERKQATLARELEKRALTLISKSRLASELPFSVFARDDASAAFIAYYTARCHVRSEFTNTAQVRPYDGVADLLFRHCRRAATTNWWAIAHVYPDPEVLRHLSEAQKGQLLGRCCAVLERTATLMQEVWARSTFDRDTMIVRRGNDSSTWNLLAGAWNQARDGWMNLLYALDLDELLDAVCPGKAMRLMAADVAWWHQHSGGQLDPNTQVWARLPLPWTVLAGEAPCTRRTVRQLCLDLGLHPEQSGWIAPRTRARVAPFRLTPELVHGVTVSSPGLARVLRRAGVFSGRPLRQVADDTLGTDQAE